MVKRIGVLALQGGFEKHITILRSLAITTLEVRSASDLSHCDALIIPGGESTTIARLLDATFMRVPLISFARQRPLFGTCAGLILMSRSIFPSAPFSPLGLLDIVVERNAFGRQVDSFETKLHMMVEREHSPWTLPVHFIRAPRIKEWGNEVQILASFDGEPVIVRQGLYLGASCHPELTQDGTLHRYFYSFI